LKDWKQVDSIKSQFIIVNRLVFCLTDSKMIYMD